MVDDVARQVPLVLDSLTEAQRMEALDVLRMRDRSDDDDRVWARIGRACASIASQCSRYFFPQVMLAVAGRRSGVSYKHLRYHLNIQIPRRTWKRSKKGCLAIHKCHAKKAGC